MIYLLYGINDYEIKEQIKQLIKKYKIDNINVVNYTLDNNIKGIIDDASTISLFSDIKAIIVNGNILDTSLNNKAYLEAYLNNYNPNTLLIFTIFSEKIDTRTKIYKLIDKHGKVLSFNKSINTFSFVKSKLSGYTITNNDIQLIIKRIGNNYDLLNQEIEKLITYKNDLIITSNDIIEVCSNNVDTNIFKFMDDIIYKRKKNALITYHELLKQNEEPIKIVTMLANNFRLMYQASNLLKKGYSEADIMKITGKGSYPIKLAIEKSYNYDNKVLLHILEELADLDYQMKTNETNKNTVLELFILHL